MVQYTHVQVNTYIYVYIYMQYTKNLKINFIKIKHKVVASCIEDWIPLHPINL